VSAVLVATERDAPRAETFERTERRIERWAIQCRTQERQLQAFNEASFVLRSANRDDGATAAVFHGERHESRRERMMREHREQREAEVRKQARRHALEVRRGTGEQVYCRHCNRLVRTFGIAAKCERCKKDPNLVTARGTEKRSFVDRREPQPDLTPLSADAQRIQAIVDGLPVRLFDVLERRYLHRQSDHEAAAAMRITTAHFSGLARAAVDAVALALANGENSRV
jgi:phage FluMu protein Com